METETATIVDGLETTEIAKREFSLTNIILDAIEFIKANATFAIKFVILFSIVKLVHDLILISAGFSTYSYYCAIPFERNSETMELLCQSHGRTNWLQVVFVTVALAPAYVSLSASLFRKALFDKEIGFFGLSFGKNEIQIAIAGILAIVPFRFSSVLMGILTLTTTNQNALIQGISTSVGWVAKLLTLWLAIRFVQGKVMVIAENDFDLHKIWLETKGNVLKLFSVDVLISLLMLLIFVPIFGLLSFLFELNFQANLALSVGNRGVPNINLDTQGIAVQIVQYTRYSVEVLMFSLASVSVYKQMNPDFAPTPPNTPTENP